MDPHHPEPYRFRPVVEADFILLHRWLGTPEVARWWGDRDEETRLMRAALADPLVAMWIIEHHGRPFAYLQDYDLHGGWPDHPWPWLPAATRGIDQFIGHAEMLNCGHGSSFIRSFTDQLFLSDVPCVVTDPHPDNIRARRAYGKAGFCGDQVHGADCDSGPSILMTRFAPGQVTAAPVRGS